MPPCLCPQCGYHITAASDHRGNRTTTPAKGDFANCLACGAIVQFDAFGTLTRSNPAELRAFELEKPEEYRRMRQSQEWVRAQKDWAPRERRGGRA